MKERAMQIAEMLAWVAFGAVIGTAGVAVLSWWAEHRKRRRKR
jgi:fatty-acid desaturase